MKTINHVFVICQGKGSSLGVFLCVQAFVANLPHLPLPLRRRNVDWNLICFSAQRNKIYVPHLLPARTLNNEALLHLYPVAKNGLLILLCYIFQTFRCSFIL